MTTALEPPRLITPIDGRNPAELTAVTEVLQEWGPETYLGFTFTRPDGGCNLWHGWTDGGPVLGDITDGIALATHLDAADWLHIGDRHRTITDRAGLRIEAFPLRPVLADVESGERSPQDRRELLTGFLNRAADADGSARVSALPWPGFGPLLLARSIGQ